MSETTMDEPMTRIEAARFCRVSLRTLVASDCPRSRVGARTIFLKSQCVRWLESRATHRLPVAS